MLHSPRYGLMKVSRHCNCNDCSTLSVTEYKENNLGSLVYCTKGIAAIVLCGNIGNGVS